MGIKEQIIEVISRVLEETAYIFTEVPAENPLPDPQHWDATGVMLRFFGKPNGTVKMWASEGFARCVAANMLGVDENDDAAAHKGFDALKETLNIILGNYLTAMYGDAPIFDLGLPEPIPNEELLADIKRPDALFFTADDYPVLFIIESDMEV